MILPKMYVIQLFTERQSDVLQKPRLGIISVCSLLLDFQRDSTVCS